MRAPAREERDNIPSGRDLVGDGWVFEWGFAEEIGRVNSGAWHRLKVVYYTQSYWCPAGPLGGIRGAAAPQVRMKCATVLGYCGLIQVGDCCNPVSRWQFGCSSAFSEFMLLL